MAVFRHSVPPGAGSSRIIPHVQYQVSANTGAILMIIPIADGRPNFGAGEIAGFSSLLAEGDRDTLMAVRDSCASALDFIARNRSSTPYLEASPACSDAVSDAPSKTASPAPHLATCLGTLTPRQRQIMDRVMNGHPSKNIAADLGLSQRTVENHRAAIMRKTGSKSLSALFRTVMAAS